MKSGRQFRTPGCVWMLVILLAVPLGIHLFFPVSHTWHSMHVLARLLFLVPILLGASWYGLRGSMTAGAMAAMFTLVHALRDWPSWPMAQAEQIGTLITYLVVAGAAGILFERQHRAHRAVHDAHEETLNALAMSLELRERYTAGHSRRVRDYALLLARKMALHDAVFQKMLARGAFLHDIGKIGIPDRILLKEGPLTEEERSVMRKHPVFGANLVGEIGFLRDAKQLISAHHERFDGKGYPRGLQGSAIPLGSRIFMVADAFDALTSDRPYHQALAYEEARACIEKGRATQFDPVVVDAFLAIGPDEWKSVARASGAPEQRDLEIIFKERTWTETRP